MAYLRVTSSSKASGFEELCPVCGDKVYSFHYGTTYMWFEELCPVCGDKVYGYHYDLLTCESCKG